MRCEALRCTPVKLAKDLYCNLKIAVEIKISLSLYCFHSVVVLVGYAD